MEVDAKLEKSNVKAPEEGASLQMDSQESSERKVAKKVLFIFYF